ncbi:hypothetical protein CMO86_06455, partial [Candidatus Woesearchaeota archaeon]|nr:hypothetical protein [Candidatus Woesearchaeota archaeon]
RCQLNILLMRSEESIHGVALMNDAIGHHSSLVAQPLDEMDIERPRGSSRINNWITMLERKMW